MSAPLSPKEGPFFAWIRPSALQAPRHRQGWGNILVLRRGNSISSPFREALSTEDAVGERRWDVASQGPFRSALLPRPLLSFLAALLRPLPGCISGLSRTEGHKSHANSEVSIFSKNPHLASQNRCQAICLRDLIHSKFSNSLFLISAEEWQSLQKQDSDVRVGRQAQEMEFCSLNIFSILCKQAEAQLPQIALLTTLTSGTPLCFLGRVGNNSGIQQ